MKKRDELFEVLLDYICAGHFEVFQHILARLEHNSSLDKKVTQTTLGQIQSSTDLCVQLNDKYQHLKKPDKNQWRKDISQVAEALAERFELEDFLIERSFKEPRINSQSA